MKRRIASALVGGLVIMGLSSLWAQKQMAQMLHPGGIHPALYLSRSQAFKTNLSR